MAPKTAPAARPAANASTTKDFAAGESDDEIQELPATANGNEIAPAARLPMLASNTMRELLMGKNPKLTFVHRGGSLPQLEFKPARDVGKTILCRFISSEKPSEDSKAPLITFDILDPEKYASNPKNVDAAVCFKRVLSAGHALKKWAGYVTKKENATETDPAGTFHHGDAVPGEIVLLTYGGELKTDSAKEPLKLFELASIAGA